MLIGNKLSATSILVKNHGKTFSNVTIKIGSLTIAQAALGGKYSEDDAIKEFKRNTKRFTAIDNADLNLYRRI